MKLVKFQEKNREGVKTLWKKCGLTVSWNNPDQDIDRKVLNNADSFLVGLIEEKVMASVMFGYDGHRGSVYYLGVDPDYQGQGYGEKIMLEVEGRVRKLGCPKINLAVRSSNVAVLDFYKKLGYSVDPVSSLGKRFEKDEPFLHVDR